MQILRLQQARRSRLPLILHGLLFLVIAAATLTYWQSTEYALNGSWSIEYYKKISYLDRVPAWQKAAKDGFAWLLLVGSLSFRATNPQVALQRDRDLGISYGICAVALIIAFIRSLFTSLPDVLLFASLRPFVFTIAIFVFCHRHLHPYYLRWVFETTNLIVLVQVYYAIRQRNSAIIYNGVDWFHSGSARAVGTFTEPNSLGLFLALMFYINLAVLPPHRFRPFLLAAIALGIFFTGSRSAQLCSLIILLVTFYRKIWRPKQSSFEDFFKNFISIPLIFLVGLWFYEQVNIYSGRGETSSSTGGRLEIFSNLTDRFDLVSLLLGKYLSFGSNIVQTLSAGDAGNNLGGGSFALADSTPAWVMGQFGLLGVFGALGVVYALLKRSIPKLVIFNPHSFKPKIEQLEKDRSGLVIYLFFSVSTIILFEFYAVLPLLITLVFPWQVNKK